MNTPFRTPLLVGLFAVFACTGAARAANVTDLLSKPDDWKTWVQRAEVAPTFELVNAQAGGKAALAIDSRNDPDAFGCWMRSLPPLKKDRLYRFEAAFEAEGIDKIDRRIWAIITTAGGGEFQELG